MTPYHLNGVPLAFLCIFKRRLVRGTCICIHSLCVSCT